MLNRGEREADEGGDDDDDFQDNVRVPSCSELKKMWKIARRIHNHAIKTNEIPQKLHPFSSFESDRFRASQRIKNRENKQNKYRSRKKPDKGSKEVADASFGIIR